MTKKKKDHVYTYLPYSWVPWYHVLAWEGLPNQKSGVFCHACKTQVTEKGCLCGATPPAYLKHYMVNHAV